MPQKRKMRDPRLLKLREQQEREQQAYDRWYSRLKRAFGQLEKHRLALIRLAKRIDQHVTEQGTRAREE